MTVVRPLLLVAVLTLAGCSGANDLPTPTGGGAAVSEVVVRTAGGERTLSVRVADTDEERRRGLMGVRDLPANDGMAFVFDGSTTATFWMQDTPIPLAIAFVSGDGHILGITEMTPCRTDPCPTYAPPGAYDWAVEANAGWFSANGAQVGDEAVLLEA